MLAYGQPNLGLCVGQRPQNWDFGRGLLPSFALWPQRGGQTHTNFSYFSLIQIKAIQTQPLTELFSFPNQLFRGWWASANRTNQPNVTALSFFPTGDSNNPLARHISLGAAIPCQFSTLQVVMPGI